MSVYCRVSYDGYVEGEYESIEDAKAEFIDIIENGGSDGRDWKDELSIETFNEKTEKWE